LRSFDGRGAGGRVGGIDRWSDGVEVARAAGAGDQDLHTGALDSLEAVVGIYRETSALAEAGELRNGAPELAAMSLTEDDVAPLAAFLAALDEDYD
jgi:hypothetical protein